MRIASRRLIWSPALTMHRAPGLLLPRIVNPLAMRSSVRTGLVTAMILLSGAVAMFFWPRQSDRHYIAWSVP